VSNSTGIEAHPLPLDTTSQKAELTALARALTLAKDKTINIYTDSKYAFHTFVVPLCNLEGKGTPNYKRNPHY
jgi:ribonuclease HI